MGTRSTLGQLGRQPAVLGSRESTGHGEEWTPRRSRLNRSVPHREWPLRGALSGWDHLADHRDSWPQSGWRIPGPLHRHRSGGKGDLLLPGFRVPRGPSGPAQRRIRPFQSRFEAAEMPQDAHSNTRKQKCDHMVLREPTPFSIPATGDQS